MVSGVGGTGVRLEYNVHLKQKRFWADVHIVRLENTLSLQNRLAVTDFFAVGFRIPD